VYELLAAAAGLLLGAWFILGADATDRARIGVALLLGVATALRLGFGQKTASTLLFASVAIGVLLFRRYRGTK